VELRHLRYFVAVAEELHFGRAAARLHISQPPLSMQIRDLEREIGCRLLSRSRRKVELTDAGGSFLEEARYVLARIEQAVETARNVGSGAAGRLSVGLISMAMDAFLTKVIQDFGRECPWIKLSLGEMSTNDLLDAVRAGRLHVGFPRLYGHDLRGLESDIVLRERYILAIPQIHPLAKKRRISLPALEGVNLIISPRPVQPRVYDRIVESCRREGFDPQITHETVSRRTSMSLVAAGLGVSIVTGSAQNVPWPGVVYRPIDADWPIVEIAAVWQEGDDRPALGRFMDVVRRHRRDDAG
jgi:DNA-binding transcriptional LysR family regulator